MSSSASASSSSSRGERGRGPLTIPIVLPQVVIGDLLILWDVDARSSDFAALDEVGEVRLACIPVCTVSGQAYKASVRTLTFGDELFELVVLLRASLSTRGK